MSDGPHEWPDGMTAEVIAAETAPAVEPDDPTLDTMIRITTLFTNIGNEDFSFRPNRNTLDGGPPVTLLYGVDRYRAPGWFYDANHLPPQLAPGSSAEWVSEFTLPRTELYELVFVIAPGRDHEPYAFTEVETLLR